MATYLVTGCAGFIGWKVSELLLDKGHVVVGVDNLNAAYDVRLKVWRLKQLEGRPGFHFHRIDITDRLSLASLPSFLETSYEPPFDAVVNLAARAGVRQSVEDPWGYYEVNVTGTLNLLELCRKYRVNGFLLASTSSVYSLDTQGPFREDASTDVPISPYAASKKAAEVLCHTYHYLYGLNVIVLRYFTVYGPAGRPDMSLFRFIQWISEGRPVTVYGDGMQSRDFTYVEDIARGTIAALSLVERKESPSYEVINLGSDRPVRLLDAIGLVENLVGKKARLEYKPRHVADVLSTWADISKAERLLGWRPGTPFEEGLRKTVDWYNEQRSWARDVRTTD